MGEVEGQESARELHGGDHFDDLGVALEHAGEVHVEEVRGAFDELR